MHVHFGSAFLQILLIFRNVLNLSLTHWLLELPTMDNEWCKRMSNGKLNDEEASRLASWSVNQSNGRYLDSKKLNPVELPEAGLEMFLDLE
jgi:hypothetical protein